MVQETNKDNKTMIKRDKLGRFVSTKRAVAKKPVKKTATKKVAKKPAKKTTKKTK